MNGPSQLPLFGFVNPREELPAFLVPIFGADSDLWFQDSRGDGLLFQFSPNVVPAEKIITDHDHKLSVKVGDPLVYAFQFPGEKIEIGPKSVIQKLLSKRLEAFRHFPFLLIDVLKFIDSRDALPEAIRNAREHLALTDPTIADQWARLANDSLIAERPASQVSSDAISTAPMTPVRSVQDTSSPVSNLFQLTFKAPRRTTLALLSQERMHHPILGDTLRRRLVNLAHLYDPRVPFSVDVGIDTGFEAERVTHPLEWVLAEGPRPDTRYCFQRLQALWLATENRSGQITNDPVLPFRHQAALLQFLTEGRSASRVLVADEVGLGKTVEAGLLIRHLLRQSPRPRILYLTLGGLVVNVLEEFQRLDLPRWHFYANIEDRTWKRLNALPTEALTAETPLVVASIHKLGEATRWKQQHEFLGATRFDLIIVDECHALRAYGATADSPQVWFRSVRQLLDEHLTAEGRVMFLSATPHQGKRDVFLNLVALCVGTPLNASEKQKAQAAHGRVVFRVKEHVRDWKNQRVFPPRDVRPPLLAEPPANYQEVLRRIGEHFDWIAQTTSESQAMAVGFVKSQALQYAASSLRAGFAYLLRRLIRYHRAQSSVPEVMQWLERLLPYRGEITSARQLLAEWVREFEAEAKRAQKEVDETIEGELSDESGPSSEMEEVPRLLSLLGSYNRLFDDPAAGAKFNALFKLLEHTPEPIVVFTQAVDTVYELELRLKARGYEVYRLTGDMLTEDRGSAVRAFRQSSNPRRLLLSSAAGGVGINLQVARVAVHFDLPWNPMVLEQRIGRIHRIGSTRTIIVETILLRGTREAEVFSRITSRLQEIVQDLSADPIEREALFRRILASLDPDALREMFSGAVGLEALGAAVDAGRKLVDEADRYMRELATNTTERQGRATMARLVEFLETAEPGFRKVGSQLFAVLTEVEGGELRQEERRTDIFRFDGDDEELVFDRTAASYLGLRRSQTGGIGNTQVDPLIRAAIDLAGEAKSRSSTWVTPSGSLPRDVQAGDILYIAFEAGISNEEFTDPRLRMWRIRQLDWAELDEAAIEHLLWDVDWAPSRRAGELVSVESLLEKLRSMESPGKLHFPIAAIGIRERGERS